MYVGDIERMTGQSVLFKSRASSSGGPAPCMGTCDRRRGGLTVITKPMETVSVLHKRWKQDYRILYEPTSFIGLAAVYLVGARSWPCTLHTFKPNNTQLVHLFVSGLVMKSPVTLWYIR